MIRGFHPIRRLGGGDIPSPISYPMASNVSIFKGDLVVATPDGTVQAAAAGANTTVVGVAAEYAVNPPGGNRTILVYSDPSIIYAVRSNGAVTAADVFLNAPNAVGSGGNPNTGLSSHVLNASAMGTSAALVCKILGKTNTPGNDWGPTNPTTELEVRLNNTLFIHGAGGL